MNEAGFPIIFRGECPARNLVPGDAYWAPEDYCAPRIGSLPPMAFGNVLTQQFETRGRRPIMVVLPGGYHFCIDSAYWSSAATDFPQVGWDVQICGGIEVDRPLRVTMCPSVNIVGTYHGFIRDGVVTADLEPRDLPET